MPAFPLARIAASPWPPCAVRRRMRLRQLRQRQQSPRRLDHALQVEVVQGNFVSKEQVEALKPGMSRQQVRDILGTPLVTSIFHADRWDYVFTLKRQGVQPQERRLAVFFKGDALERFEGDEMPSEAEFVATLDNKRKARKVPAARGQRGQLKQFAPGAACAAAAAAGRASPRRRASYPPLEAGRRADRHGADAAIDAQGGRRRRQRPHGPHADRGDPRIRRLPARRRARRRRQPGDRQRRRRLPRPASGVPITADLAPALANAEVLIDFTRPEGTLAHLEACRELGVNAVIGTTGFNDGAEGADRRRRARHRDRDGAQHERRRQRHAEAARDGRQGAVHRLRHRDHRGAPPPQGRRAVGHRAEDGRGDRRRRSAAT